MGSSCCKPTIKDIDDERFAEEDTGIPDVPPAVFIDLAIPGVPEVPSNSEMSIGEEQIVTTNWENVVNFDKIITSFTQSSGVLCQLKVRQHDSLYFKRLCGDGSKEKPKPVIIATVTDPGKTGWVVNTCQGTLWKVLDTEFGQGVYQISIDSSKE